MKEKKSKIALQKLAKMLEDEEKMDEQATVMDCGTPLIEERLSKLEK